MEKLVFESPGKHRIIAVKNLLAENGVPASSVKLHISVEWSSGGRKGEGRKTTTMEQRNDLNVPVEDFNEALNDSQAFELYVGETHEDRALEIIESINSWTFFNDCVYKSGNYDEAFDKYLLLVKNNIRCGDVFEDNGEYLLSVDPENKEQALKIINKTKY